MNTCLRVVRRDRLAVRASDYEVHNPLAPLQDNRDGASFRPGTPNITGHVTGPMVGMGGGTAAMGGGSAAMGAYLGGGYFDVPPERPDPPVPAMVLDDARGKAADLCFGVGMPGGRTGRSAKRFQPAG